MNRNIVLFITLCLSWQLLAQKRISIQDFGAEAGIEDATYAIIKALEECKKHEHTELVFPKGEYHFYPDFGIDKYCFISNNDEGLKRIIFPLIDMQNVTIDGNGSSFIFHGFVNPFLVENSSNIQFKNFSIDCARPFHSEGVILANHKDGLDLEFSEQYPYEIVNGVLQFTDGSKNEQRATTVSRDEVFPYTSLLEFDSQKRETAFMAQDYFLNNTPLVAKEIGDKKVRIYFEGLKGTVGNIMTFGAGTRNYPGFTISDSKDTHFQNVTIHHSGGMGVLGQRSHNISLDSCRVTPSEGRIISSTADATHFTNCTGKIELGNCLFENQKDDATNIHGIYVHISKQLAANEFVVELRHAQQYGFDFLTPNTKIEFVKAKSLITKGYAKVVESERLNKQYTRLKVSAPLPADIIVGDAIGSAEDFAQVHIHHNTIRNNRARGMLLNCRGKTMVEHNYFHTPGASILFEGDANHWYEQGGVHDCTIRNNVFDSCLFGVWGEAIIDVQAGITEDKELSRYNKNIKIEDNIFRLFDDVLLLNAFGVDGLVWRNNKVEQVDSYRKQRKRNSLYKVEFSDNINIQD